MSVRRFTEGEFHLVDPIWPIVATSGQDDPQVWWDVLVPAPPLAAS